MACMKPLVCRAFAVFLSISLIAAGLGKVNPVLAQTAVSRPVLILTADKRSSYHWGKYLGEILTTEGFPLWEIRDLDTAGGFNNLEAYGLVILARVEGTLPAGTAEALTAYLAGGGNVIAMQPADALSGLFGLQGPGTTHAGMYVGFDSAGNVAGALPARGLPSGTLQILGNSLAYSLAGASRLATLYNPAGTATTLPAITVSPYQNGMAVAYAYDLAETVIHMRQGTPLNGAGTDLTGDGLFTTADLFQSVFGQPSVDLTRFHLAQTDVHMRYFAMVAKALLERRMPIPRIWYFPEDEPTLLVLNGVAENTSISNLQLFVDLLHRNSAGATFLMNSQVPIPDSYASSLMNFPPFPAITSGILPGSAPAFPVSPCTSELCQGIHDQVVWWDTYHSLTPFSRAVTTNDAVWEGWTEVVQYEVNEGLALDLSYLTYGDWLWKADGTWAHGSVTGSGQPMRFISTDGTLLPVYQQVVQLVDRQMMSIDGTALENLTPIAAAAVAVDMMDRSRFEQYQALGVQFSLDNPLTSHEWLELVLMEADARGIPAWSADRWLNFTELRNESRLEWLSWSDARGILIFTLNSAHVTDPDFAMYQGDRLSLLIPLRYQNRNLIGLRVNGLAVPIQSFLTAGSDDALLSGVPAGAQVEATYQSNIDLGVEIQSTPYQHYAGLDRQIQFGLTNNGPVPVTDAVFLSSELPAWVDWVPSPGCSMDPGTRRVRCAALSLPAGQVTPLTLIVHYPPEAKGSYLLSGSVSSPSGLDPNLANNTSAAQEVIVTRLADVRLTGGGRLFYRNGERLFEMNLLVRNNGPSFAEKIEVGTIYLDNGIDLQSATPPCAKRADNLAVGCSPIALMPGEETAMQITLSMPGEIRDGSVFSIAAWDVESTDLVQNHTLAIPVGIADRILLPVVFANWSRFTPPE